MQSTSEQLVPPQKRGILDYLILAAKGFCMGGADVVPGVSGGTMAFILGIYEELITSIRSVGRSIFWRKVLNFDVVGAFNVLHGSFLIAIFVGIGTAILLLAPALEWLLENQPVYLWSFFFGLVVASVVTVSRRIKQWSVSLFLALIVGTIASYIIVGLVPRQTPETWWFILLSGALASCAMILPGISGSFILVLLGKYQFFLSAVNDRDITPILLAGIGAAIGLVTFAQVLGWLFKRFHDMTVAVLIGLMIGSLRKIWPWKVTLETYLDRHGVEVPLIEQNVLPAVDTDLLIAIGLMLIGFVLVITLERLAIDHD